MSASTACDERLNRADLSALAMLTEAVRDGREGGDERPALTLIAECLVELGVALPEQRHRDIPLDGAKEEWLRRIRSAGRSASTISAYRIALDDLLAYLERTGRRKNAFAEETIVAYLTEYRDRAEPADATYYRRFTLLRNFFRWLGRRHGLADPFLDLEPPRNIRPEADWLTPDEFARLLEAAGTPERRRPGLAERDRLVLLTLVATGLRRSELLALNWGDLELDSDRPSVLVRRGKGNKARRQPLPPALAEEFVRLRAALSPAHDASVFCGLAGKRLSSTILATIIQRSAKRAAIQKHVSAHTLRHTAATWLRQQTGDARLVAAYLGHADLSTVSRYAHVATDELHAAANVISDKAGLTVPRATRT
jgi:site-specific recombinase XerD